MPDAANALNVDDAYLVGRAHPGGTALGERAVQEQLRQASGLPVSNVRTMSEVVSTST